MAELAEPGSELVNHASKRKVKLAWVGLLFLAALLLAGGYWWLYGLSRVSTDNAYVMADSAAVSSRVSGTINRVVVGNDDLVSAGQLLVELDPRDYTVELERQKAALSYTEVEIEVAEATLSLTDSQTAGQLLAAEAAVQAAQEKEKEMRHRIEELEKNRAAAEADLSNSRREFERYANLLKEGAGSEQQRDRTRTVYQKAQAHFQATDAQIGAARAGLSAATEGVDRARAERDVAKANRRRVDIEKKKIEALKAKRAETLALLEKAELNLSYCAITAPISGYIAQKRIQVGERVQQGQPLLAVVPLKEVYVEANFKESQLKDVRIGQPAEIRSDIYPDHIYQGKVAGIRAGTGAAFSLLPPENATGNWIKIVQRIPVKILLDAPPPPQFPLRIGASLDVTVFTAHKDGAMLRTVQKDLEDREARSKE